MGRFFQPARIPGAGASAPNIQRMNYTAAQTFKKGAILVYVAAGTVQEAAADPVLAIVGIALDPAASAPGFDPANAAQVLQVTGREESVSVAKAESETIFSGRAVNGGTDPVTPTLSHIGEEYGTVKVGNDWVIDIADTTNKSIRIVDIDIDQKIFFFKFMAAVLTPSP